MKLKKDEAIIYEVDTNIKEIKDNLHLVLTSERLFIKKNKGVFRTTKLPLKKIKKYNEKYLISRKNNSIKIQTTRKEITLLFCEIKNAKDFENQLYYPLTGKTLNQIKLEKLQEKVIKAIPITIEVGKKLTKNKVKILGVLDKIKFQK